MSDLIPCSIRARHEHHALLRRVAAVLRTNPAATEAVEAALAGAAVPPPAGADVIERLEKVERLAQWLETRAQDAEALVGRVGELEAGLAAIQDRLPKTIPLAVASKCDTKRDTDRDAKPAEPPPVAHPVAPADDDFPARLAAVIDARGISKAEADKLAGLSNAVVSKLIKGTKRATDRDREKLVAAFPELVGELRRVP